ncbi:MAG: nucleotidyltransferase family protein [Thermaerobacter sp.]|jgi:predicted nucleotidyltransferase|nr:nucleotidyltransferase family protein [Thermaerobacter sp.]
MALDGTLIRLPINNHAIAAICRDSGIKELSLFGSVTRDDFDPERSDVDMLVEFLPNSPVKSLFDLIRVKHQMEDLFQRAVDLIDVRAIDPYIKDDVLRSKVTVYVAPR